MKAGKIEKFSDSEDLIVRVECAECGAVHRMLVPDGAWNEHIKECPLADRSAYLAEWAYSLRCPSCGAVDERDASEVAQCTCKESRDKMRISEFASKAFERLQDHRPGDMSGWIYADGYLGVMEANKRTASIELNEDAENDGEAYPAFTLTVEKRGKDESEYKTVYSADIDLPPDAEFDAYLSAVKTLKDRAELVFNVVSKTRVHESLDANGAVMHVEQM